MLVVKTEIELIYVRCHQLGRNNKFHGYFILLMLS